MHANPLVYAIGRILRRIGNLKKLAKEFYFEVLLSVHPCPKCGGRLKMTGQSECTCSCGYIFDPTLAFQKSTCCDAELVRKTFHYACSRCHKIVPSRFLFDERVFDKSYFREMMQESRKRARQKREETRLLLAGSRSGALAFMEALRLESVPGLIRDLDHFIGNDRIGENNFVPDMCPDFKMNDYRDHILDFLRWDSLLFSDINPIIEDLRKDQIRRFVTLVFMQNDREVMLSQHGSDLLIERCVK